MAFAARPVPTHHNISHRWLLTHVPMDSVILEKWLRCGFLENSKRFATEEGTPQGVIISLSAEKTQVTHIQKGFDFLGQNIRKYGRKLLITPAQKNVHAALTKLRWIIEKNKSATQENLIVQLNPVIRGWAQLSSALCC